MNLTTALLMASNLAGGVAACPDNEDSGYHLMDVCDDYLEGNDAFSVSYRASLSSRPAQQQVAVFQYEGEWKIWVAGYRWERGTEVVEHRRNEMVLSDEDAAQITALISQARLSQLSQQFYYGREDVICTDGAALELARVDDGQRQSAAQHSCAGRTEINEIAAEFRRLALKYDPAFEGMLRGLR